MSQTQAQMKQRLEKETRLSSIQDFVIEQRADDESGSMKASGYPVVFDKETFIGFEGRGFYESIDPRAFDNADMSDVCLRYNHSDNFLIMARTRNDSLRLSVDDTGLRMDSDLIPTSFNKDMYLATRAGLLTEGSFAFTVRKDDKEKRSDGYIHRRILEVGKLFDVSICDNGAYGDKTAIYARSLEQAEAWLRQVETEKGNKTKIDYKSKTLITMYGGMKNV
jgi:HK97 family phage prohead protease